MFSPLNHQLAQTHQADLHRQAAAYTAAHAAPRRAGARDWSAIFRTVAGVARIRRGTPVTSAPLAPAADVVVAATAAPQS
jgi:hypothetical protein